MSQKNYFEHIEPYLDGTLPDQDRKDFDDRLKTDNALAEALEEARTATDVIDVLVQVNLKEKLKRMEKQRAQSNRFSLRKMLIPLAAALILGVLTISYFGIRANYSDNGLVADNLELYPGTGVRGSSEIDQGVKAYTEKNYASAMAYFEGIPQGDSYYSTAQFYLGNIYLENGLAAKAVKAFQRVGSKNDSRFAEASEWYLALAFLKNGQRQNAEDALNQVTANTQHAYRDQANDLLNKLGSPMRKLPGI